MGQYSARGRKFFLIVTIIFIIDAIPTPQGDGNQSLDQLCLGIAPGRNPYPLRGRKRTIEVFIIIFIIPDAIPCTVMA